ncbi:hypothetical protein BD779DRAFT_1608509 [Infundibulicybe gibba]|nr:hypothetical protein BD779DRAFT_1608509 [Infundibulicybe gibba]
MRFPLDYDYSLTRRFRWPWFSPMATVAAVVVLALLTTLNVALTGYQTKTVFEDNFNVTQTHWYDKPGTLCDSHVFNVGDSLTTNYTIFQWSIETVNKPNAASSGVSYRGSTLQDCDLSNLYIDGDMRTRTIKLTAVAKCEVKGEFEVNAKTTFAVSALAGVHSPLLGVLKSSPTNGTGDKRGVLIDQLSQIAGQDVSDRLTEVITSTNGASPVLISLQVDFPWCPASAGADAPCATQPPAYNISYASALYANTTLLMYNMFEPASSANPRIIDANTQDPINNMVQLIYAAIRIDFGNPAPNNFLLNPSSLDSTINSTFPATPNPPQVLSQMNAFLQDPILRSRFDYPVALAGPASIQVVYLCRFQVSKAIGEGIISVLVATLSMFSTAWAIFMVAATYFAKRNHTTVGLGNGSRYGGNRNGGLGTRCGKQG